jgi:hypothetical protein
MKIKHSFFIYKLFIIKKVKAFKNEVI